ncbi:hypothetical protein GCM10009634_52140 [Saccharothrix xinjiangensis]
MTARWDESPHLAGCGVGFLAHGRPNMIMKKVTGWAAIIALPTAVTGFYGQNVPYPGYDQPWGFWVSTAVMVLLSVGLYVSFKRRDWL